MVDKSFSNQICLSKVFISKPCNSFPIDYWLIDLEFFKFEADGLGVVRMFIFLKPIILSPALWENLNVSHFTVTLGMILKSPWMKRLVYERSWDPLHNINSFMITWMTEFEAGLLKCLGIVWIMQYIHCIICHLWRIIGKMNFGDSAKNAFLSKLLNFKFIINILSIYYKRKFLSDIRKIEQIEQKWIEIKYKKDWTEIWYEVIMIPQWYTLSIISLEIL